MTITTALCNSFKAELLAMTPHAAGDVYKIALFTSTATLNKSTIQYSTTDEVVATGYTAGGLTLVGMQIVADGDSAILDFTTNPVWPASTITARGALIYNSSKGNKSLATFDFGTDINSTNGSFTAVLPNPTAAAGLIKLN